MAIISISDPLPAGMAPAIFIRGPELRPRRRLKVHRATQLDALLRDHRARTEIHDTLMRYCRGVDRLDRDLILSAYHPGARDNHGSFDGPVEDFVDWVFENHLNQVI